MNDIGLQCPTMKNDNVKNYDIETLFVTARLFLAEFCLKKVHTCTKYKLLLHTVVASIIYLYYYITR